MQPFDIKSTLKNSALAYYSNDHGLAGYLLKGCLRSLSLLPLNNEQASYLNNVINDINQRVTRGDYTGLADVIMFELIQNFPDFDALLVADCEANN